MIDPLFIWCGGVSIAYVVWQLGTRVVKALTRVRVVAFVRDPNSAWKAVVKLRWARQERVLGTDNQGSTWTDVQTGNEAHGIWEAGAQWAWRVYVDERRRREEAEQRWQHLLPRLEQQPGALQLAEKEEDGQRDETRGATPETRTPADVYAEEGQGVRVPHPGAKHPGRTRG